MNADECSSASEVRMERNLKAMKQPTTWNRQESGGQKETKITKVGSWNRFISFVAFCSRSLPLLMCLLAVPTFAVTNDLTTLLQRGLFEEEANRNLDAAITSYESLAKQFDKDRQIAATAVFRLGECYRKLGKTNEAVVQYERILRDFSDQQTLATLSRQNLAGMGMRTELRSTTARLNQNELLAKQIELADQDLADVKKKFETGQATQADIRAAEREVLRLRQQLAALDNSVRRDLLEDVSVPDDEEKEIRRIQTMIQNSPDLINSGGARGTPLGKAVNAGWLRVAAFLLEHGANVNLKSDGAPPLVIAALSGNKAMTELLLDRGADVNATDGGGRTALHTASVAGFLSVAEVLLRRHDDVNARDSERNGRNTPLHLAAARGNNEIVRLLLANGAELDARKEKGITPLMEAIFAHHEKTASILLDAKANANIVDETGRTALGYAVLERQPEIIQKLIQAKADPNKGELDRPIFWAIKYADTNAANLLLQAGADPNLPGKNSDSLVGFSSSAANRPLEFALWYQAPLQTEMVKLLLRFKAAPNAIGFNGEPLIFLSLRYATNLQTLLAAGADPNVISTNGGYAFSGETPLMLACRQHVEWSNESKNWSYVNTGEIEGVKLLIRHGAKVTVSRPTDGMTPLHMAVSTGNKELVEFLLTNGAEANVWNKEGLTPLDICKRAVASPNSSANVEEIAAMLRTHGALDDFPKWDRLLIRQPQDNIPKLAALKTEKANQYSLLELLALNYKIPRSPGAIDFPDFSRITVRRPQADGKKWKEVEIDLKPYDTSGACSNDFGLQWGDIIEIPQTDHLLNEVWQGLPLEMADRIENCLSRIVVVKFRGEQKHVTLAPSTSRGPQGIHVTDLPFDVGSAINKAGFNRSSADLSRVKVVRQSGGQSTDWILDCSKAPQLLLRNGDVIEVPEK
jgi:ankyrin repeat protein